MKKVLVIAVVLMLTLSVVAAAGFAPRTVHTDNGRDRAVIHVYGDFDHLVRYADLNGRPGFQFGEDRIVAWSIKDCAGDQPALIHNDLGAWHFR